MTGEFLARKTDEENEELTGLKKSFFRGKKLENRTKMQILKSEKKLMHRNTIKIVWGG